MNQKRYIYVIGLMALQIFCAVFFAGDAIHDFIFERGTAQAEKFDWLEYLVSATLLIGLGFIAFELRNMIHRDRRLSQQVGIASGAFAEILEAQFESWGLTNAEQDVALLAIKGFSVAEIANLRNTREGTIKAQNAAIYRKAGVSGRTQLLSRFIEDLMTDDLLANTKEQAD